MQELVLTTMADAKCLPKFCQNMWREAGYHVKVVRAVASSIIGLTVNTSFNNDQIDVSAELLTLMLAIKSILSQ
jgi:hypothetical protein